MPTWLTGALVSVRMATSASERPRNSQMSPVAAGPSASSRESTDRKLRTRAAALEADRVGGPRRRGGHRSGRGAAAARAPRVRPGGAARAVAPAPRPGGADVSDDAEAVVLDGREVR